MSRDYARALKPFAAILAIAGAALGLDLYHRRPVAIPTPVYADSLAGVIKRLYPHADSALVGRVRWRQSPASWLGLNWIPVDQYRYRDSTASGTAPIIAQADLYALTITFAAGQLTPGTVKHELVHILLHEPNHPAAIFARIEGYHGQ